MVIPRALAPRALALVALSLASRVGALDLDPRYATLVASGAVGGSAVALVASETLDGSTGWGWTGADTALEVSFAALATLDMLQTGWFRARGGIESNPLLGSTPSQREVTLGIGACVVAHGLVSLALPRPYRSLWQGAGIGVELSAVLWNRSLGVGLRVPW